MYELVAGRAHVAGIDVRTVGVSLVVADLAGTVVAAADLGVAENEQETVGAVVDGLAAALRRAGVATPHTIAIGAPGLIDPATGELRNSSGLPRWHADLVTALRRRLKATVILENEVNLAALADQRQGAARDRDTFALLWLGQAVGAATVLDGQLRRGASGGAGEIGFLAVPGTAGLPAATSCDNGFHSLAASSAVCDLARRHGLPVADNNSAPAAEAVVHAAARATADAGTGATVRADAARDFLDDLAANIALGAHAICVVLDPGCVVLGGEVGRAGGSELATRVASRLAELSPLRTDVRAAEVPGSAVLAGAVLTALDAARADLFTPTARPEPSPRPVRGFLANVTGSGHDVDRRAGGSS